MARTNTQARVEGTWTTRRLRYKKATRPGRTLFLLTTMLLSQFWAGLCLSADGHVEHYAVIIGVSDYPGEKNDLAFPAADANDVYETLLMDPDWNPDNIYLLLDEQATPNAVYQAVLDMAARADEDDVCLFYFSGHGTNYWDMPPYDEWDYLDEYLVLYDGYLCDDEFGHWMGLLPTAQYVVILDTCFSGGAIKGPDDMTSKGLGAFISDPYDGVAPDVAFGSSLKDLDDCGRGVVLTASDANEYSMEDPQLGHGIFTYFLLEGLAGAADLDWDGSVSAEECYVYVATHMAIYTEEQHPQLYDSSEEFLNLLDASDYFGITIAGHGWVSNLPFLTSYPQSRTTSIFPDYEIGQYGSITSISLDVALAPTQELETLTIRMKHTDVDEYAAPYLDTEGWTTVYQGSVPVSEAGWWTFELQTPFWYNGTDNLMVDVSIDNSSHSVNSLCRCSVRDRNRTTVACSEGQYGIPTNWPEMGTPPMAASKAVPNIFLVMDKSN